MGKAKTKVKAREKRRVREYEDREDGTVIPFKRKFESERQAPPIVAMNARQAEYIAYLRIRQQRRLCLPERFQGCVGLGPRPAERPTHRRARGAPTCGR